MAVITQEMGSLENDTILFEVDIEDSFTPPRNVTFRCKHTDVNGRAAYAEITRRGDGRKYSSNFLPGITAPVPVLATALDRIEVVWSVEKSHYHGWDGQIMSGGVP